MKTINKTYTSENIESISFIEEKIKQGDLTQMMNMNPRGYDYNYINQYKPNIINELVDDIDILRYKSNNTNGKKLVMFRDSYTTALVPFISKEFSESVFVWSHQFDKDLIERENPDVVIFECVERYSDRLRN